MNDGAREFDCLDCGTHVVLFCEPSANDNAVRCLECQWVANLPEQHQEKMRAFFRERDAV